MTTVKPAGVASYLKLFGTRSAVLFSGVGVLASSLARILVTTILARALGPQQYDAVAVAGLYLGLIVLALDPGVSVALIQIGRLNRFHLGAAAAISLAGGCIVSLGTFIYCVGFVNDPTVVTVMCVVAIVPVLRSAGLVPQSLLFRDRRMRIIAAGETVAAILQVTGTLLGVFIAPGPLAFAFPVVASELLLAALWVRFGGEARPRFHKASARELWALASRNATTNLSNVLSRNIDTLIVGVAFGSTALSLYSVAYRFLWLPVQLIGQVVSRVAVPEFAATLRASQPIGESLLRSTARLSTLATATITPIALAGPFIVVAIFGSDWVAAGPIVSLLSFAGMTQTATYLLRAAWTALGKVSFLARFSVIAAGLSLLGFLLGALVGLLWIPASYLVVLLGLMPKMISYTAESCHIEKRRLWKAVLYGWPIFTVQASILVPLFGSPLQRQNLSFTTGALILICSLVAGATVALFRMNRLNKIMGIGSTQGAR